MQLAPAHDRTATPSLPSAATDRLDELGRIQLVRFDYRTIPGSQPSNPPLAKVATAVPTWNLATIERSREVSWDEFWAERPAGVGRLTRLDATTYDQAIKAARLLALTTRPNMAPGDKQAQGVLQLADGSFHAASLGGIDEVQQGMWLLRMGSYPGYLRPKAAALVPELLAVVGGASLVDLRGKLGVPVQT